MTGICKNCRESISFDGQVWDHIPPGKYRHVAAPESSVSATPLPAPKPKPKPTGMIDICFHGWIRGIPLDDLEVSEWRMLGNDGHEIATLVPVDLSKVIPWTPKMTVSDMVAEKVSSGEWFLSLEDCLQSSNRAEEIEIHDVEASK